MAPTMSIASSGYSLCVVVSLLLLTVRISIANGAEFKDNDVSDDGWEAFKERYGKNYGNSTEDGLRRAIREMNLQTIAKHNEEAGLGLHNFTLGENEFVDWTPSERRKMFGYRQHPAAATNSSRRRRQLSQPPMPIYANTVDTATLPDTVNWTTSGWVGPVMNQGKCGSSWAYSSAAAIGAQHTNKTKTWVELSAQNLIECSYPEGDMGCDGGNQDDAFWYVQTNGIQSAATYPDASINTTINGTCQFVDSESVTNIDSWRNIQRFNELALQQAVALAGPVVAGIDASRLSFQLYKGGVYSPRGCSPYRLNLAVLIVGYGLLNDQSYWLVQNSWGKSWGIDGFMMISRGHNNMCGIASAASFPVIN